MSSVLPGHSMWPLSENGIYLAKKRRNKMARSLSRQNAFIKEQVSQCNNVVNSNSYLTTENLLRVHKCSKLLKNNLQLITPCVVLYSGGKEIKSKHNAELQRADPGTKVTGLSSTRGHIFPYNAQNGVSLFSWF